MRRLVLFAGSLLVWLAMLVVAWNHRYERVPGSVPLTLKELKPVVPNLKGVTWHGSEQEPILRLAREKGEAALSFRVALPQAKEIDAMHLRGCMKATGLVCGNKDWYVGRLMLNWVPLGGGAAEQDPIAKIENDDVYIICSQVAVPADGPAVPLLYFGHHGVAGHWELSELEIQPVRERAFWKAGKWLFALGFFVWLYLCLRCAPDEPRWKSLVTSAILLLLLLQFVVPGPWKIQRPLACAEFSLGSAIEKEEAVSTPRSISNESVDSAKAPIGHIDGQEATSAEVSKPLGEQGSPDQLERGPTSLMVSGEVPAIEKVVARGAWIMRLKERFQLLRPILHVIQFFGPALALAWLLGARKALVVCGGLALATESSQFAFGYGFDLVDVTDLLLDGLGIGLGAYASRLIPRVFESKRWMRGWFAPRSSRSSP